MKAPNGASHSGIYWNTPLWIDDHKIPPCQVSVVVEDGLMKAWMDSCVSSQVGGLTVFFNVSVLHDAFRELVLFAVSLAEAQNQHV